MTDLRFLGLARRAGKLEIGEEAAGRACRSGKAALLLLAGDASANARGRAENFTAGDGRKIDLLVLNCSKEELGRALGLNGPAMAAVTDRGFAKGILARLDANESVKQNSAAERG